MASSKLISRFRGQAHWLLFFLIAAASVLLALQPQSGYTQNAASKAGSILRPTQEQAVNVKAYVAVGDGVTNDTAALIKALAACAAAGGTCLVPEGTYLISASGISTGRHRPSVLSGVHLRASGRAASILKIAGMPTDNFLPCEGDNWSVEKLTFDIGDYTPSVGSVAIACKGNNWRVSN
jgi:hypothetical protein